MTFSGKHTETENFIFSIQAYAFATRMTDRDAAEFLTLYLRNDALTWWRSFCVTMVVYQLYSKTSRFLTYF